mmetsp:Transcript_14554/g.38935  ORF Transcript_14554/g.38935 Transcript_14554/m.38935 type:complete len:646 (-) Transcript_14554:1023-2960(-)
MGEKAVCGDGRELQEVGARLRCELPLRDKYHRLRKYRNVFTGRDLCAWLMDTEYVDTEESAVELGNMLIRANVIQHVENRELVRNNAVSLYRFASSEQQASCGAHQSDAVSSDAHSSKPHPSAALDNKESYTQSFRQESTPAILSSSSFSQKMSGRFQSARGHSTNSTTKTTPRSRLRPSASVAALLTSPRVSTTRPTAADKSAIMPTNDTLSPRGKALERVHRNENGPPSMDRHPMVESSQTRAQKNESLQKAQSPAQPSTSVSFLRDFPSRDSSTSSDTVPVRAGKAPIIGGLKLVSDHFASKEAQMATLDGGVKPATLESLPNALQQFSSDLDDAIAEADEANVKSFVMPSSLPVPSWALPKSPRRSGRLQASAAACISPRDRLAQLNSPTKQNAVSPPVPKLPQPNLPQPSPAKLHGSNSDSSNTLHMTEQPPPDPMRMSPSTSALRLRVGSPRSVLLGHGGIRPNASGIVPERRSGRLRGSTSTRQLLSPKRRESVGSRSSSRKALFSPRAVRDSSTFSAADEGSGSDFESRDSSHAGPSSAFMQKISGVQLGARPSVATDCADDPSAMIGKRGFSIRARSTRSGVNVDNDFDLCDDDESETLAGKVSRKSTNRSANGAQARETGRDAAPWFSNTTEVDS